jgi:hypothetical protein
MSISIPKRQSSIDSPLATKHRLQASKEFCNFSTVAPKGAPAPEEQARQRPGQA